MNSDFWHGTAALVTGGTGFLGSWLTMLLLRLGAKVVVLVRDGVAESNFRLSGLDQRVDIVHGSVENYATLERAINEYEVKIVFHLAAQPIVSVAARSPRSTFATNILGTVNVLEAVRNTPCVQRIAIASSDKAYGPTADLPYLETHPLQGRFPYEASKACTDLVAFSYWHTYFEPSAGPLLGIARCTNLFGGGDLNIGRVVPKTIRSAIEGGKLTYNRCVRHFLYVLDAARAYLVLVERLHEDGVAGQAFNFGAEDGALSMKELVAERIAGLARRRGHPTPRAKQLYYPADYPASASRTARPGEVPEGCLQYPPGEIKAQWLSCEKARRLLGWTPLYSLDEGLEDAFCWYERWLKKSDMAQANKRSDMAQVNKEILDEFLAADGGRADRAADRAEPCPVGSR